MILGEKTHSAMETPPQPWETRNPLGGDLVTQTTSEAKATW